MPSRFWDTTDSQIMESWNGLKPIQCHTFHVLAAPSPLPWDTSRDDVPWPAHTAVLFGAWSCLFPKGNTKAERRSFDSPHPGLGVRDSTMNSQEIHTHRMPKNHTCFSMDGSCSVTQCLSPGPTRNSGQLLHVDTLSA